MSVKDDDPKIGAALKYLDAVKRTFSDRPKIYATFLKIVKCFKCKEIDSTTMKEQISVLFGGEKELTAGLNMFLPNGCEKPSTDVVKNVEMENNTKVIQRGLPLNYAPMYSKIKNGNYRPLQEAVESRLEFDQGPIKDKQRGGAEFSSPIHDLLEKRRNENRGAEPSSPIQDFIERQRRDKQGGLELSAICDLVQRKDKHLTPLYVGDLNHKEDKDRLLKDVEERMDPDDVDMILNPETSAEFGPAVNFMSTIKDRFESDPKPLKTFLDILHNYHANSTPLGKVLDEVSNLFSEHPDLVKNFKDFLPHGEQIYSRKGINIPPSSSLGNSVKDEQRVVKVLAGSRRPRPEEVELENKDPPNRSQRKKTLRHVKKKQEPKVSPPKSSLVEDTKKLREEHQDTDSSHNMRASPRRAVKRKWIYDRKNGGESRGRNKAKHKGKGGEAVEYFPSINEHHKHLHALRTRSHSDTLIPSSSKCRSKRLLQGRHKRSTRRATAAGGTIDSFPLKTSAVNGSSGTAIENIGHAFLSKATTVFYDMCKLAWEDFLACLELYSSGKLAKDLLFEVVYDVCGGNEMFCEDLNGIEKYMCENGYSCSKPISHIASVPLNKLDFSGCRTCTPSYKELPFQCPRSYCSTRGNLEQNVLNNTWVSVPVGSQSTDVQNDIHQNSAELRLFEFEEDRFELDMLLNVALSTIERLEPIATEIEALTEIENHQDTKITSGHGLPLFAYFNIGKNALNRVHLNMIKRLYGEFGDEVLMNLKNHPKETVPVVLRQLKKKTKVWRNAQRKEQIFKPDECDASAFSKSLDYRSESHRLNSKLCYSSKELLKGLSRQLAWPEENEEPLKMSVFQDVSLRRIFVNDVGALINITAKNDVRFTTYSSIVQTYVLRHLDAASDGFIPLLMFIEEGYASEDQMKEIFDELNLVDVDDKPEENKLPSKDPEGGGGGDNIVCIYVGTVEEYLIVRLYCIFVTKLETAWIRCQELESNKAGSLTYGANKAVLSHANAVKFNTKDSSSSSSKDNRIIDNKNNQVEAFAVYRAFLGLVGAWLGKVISQEIYEESIRQFMGKHTYEFLSLDNLASRLLFQLSRTAGKMEHNHKLRMLAKYERLNLIKHGIPLSWDKTISRARAIVKSLHSSHFSSSVNGLYVMAMRQNGSIEFRHVTPSVPAKPPDKRKEKTQRMSSSM